MRKIISFIFIVLIWACTKQEPATKTVTPQSEFIRITGRVKHEGDSVTLYWSGTNITARFTGQELKALLRD
ncbi:MAG TPA: hypothetical protein VIM65_21565, partial [Cyclobacteriaceae bacterium]